MPYIKTRDGTDLYVKDWGHGRPVILIHGWPLDADSWDEQSMALAEHGFRVIAYDRRGFGRSGQPFLGYDYDTLADDLADVIEQTGVDQAALVGFSMGGGEIARYMSRHGGAKVAKAVLVSSVVPYMLQTDDNPDGTPASKIDQIKDGLRKDRPKFLADFWPGFFGVGMFSGGPSQEVIDWTQFMALHAGLKPTIACVDAFARTDFRPDLASFTVPTLVIHGTGDKTVPIDAAGRAAAAGIAGARLIEYDGAPHAVTVTHAQRLSDDLIAFLG